MVRLSTWLRSGSGTSRQSWPQFLAIARAGAPCHALIGGVGVRIDEHTAYEPDAPVYCGSELPNSAMIVPNPVIVVEVLSPTTEHHGTSAKLIGYFKLASVHHYLVIDPDEHVVTHHAPADDGGISARHVTTGHVFPVSPLLQNMSGRFPPANFP
jgi:Uma2 family endonuclease